MIEGYSAYYGVLLDMVGGKDATFYFEGESYNRFAPSVVDKIWNKGIQLGYSANFIRQVGFPGLTDDHIFMNKAGIPSIDIIEYNGNEESSFMPHWHKHTDTMENIDKNTLKAVGQTLLQVLYNE